MLKRGSLRLSISTRKTDARFVSFCFSICFSVSCQSLSLVFAVAGITWVMFNGLVVFPSVTCISLSEMRAILNGPFHFRFSSLYTRTCCQRTRLKRVAGGSLLVSAVRMRCSATYASISRLAEFIALNRSTCLGLCCSGAGHVGRVPKTNNEGTSPFGPIVSFKALTASLRANSRVVLGCWLRIERYILRRGRDIVRLCRWHCDFLLR